MATAEDQKSSFPGMVALTSFDFKDGVGQSEVDSMIAILAKYSIEAVYTVSAVSGVQTFTLHVAAALRESAREVLASQMTGPIASVLEKITGTALMVVGSGVGLLLVGCLLVGGYYLHDKYLATWRECRNSTLGYRLKLAPYWKGCSGHFEDKGERAVGDTLSFDTDCAAAQALS